MKKIATIEDVKRIWNLMRGYYIDDKEERERQWRGFIKQKKREGFTVETLYTFLSKASGRV